MKTHNIGFLITKCAEIDSDFSNLSEVAYLTEYAVQMRYPDDFFIPEIDETKTAFRDANKVKQLVLKKVNVNK